MMGLHVGDALLRHPSNPVEMEWPLGEELYPLAFAYVKKVGHHLKLRPELLAGLERPALAGWSAARADATPPKGVVLRWFALEEPDAGDPDPRNSFFFAAGEKQSGVLLAGVSMKSGSQKKVYFSRPRLRVVFHVHETAKKRYVRFTGLSTTAEPSALESTPIEPAPAPPDPGPEGPEVFAEVLPLDPASIAGAERPEDLEAVGPDQPSSAFKKAQERKSLGKLPAGNPDRVALTSKFVHVFKSSLVDAGQHGGPKEVSVQKANGGLEATETQARTKDFAATSAYYHARTLFERMAQCGVDAERYFRCAQLPVGIEYRADFQRGSGGNWRNADVRWSVAPQYDARGRILMRFGIADHNLDAPLSLACDVRWFWHELGHVLLMAAAGEREFRFCHSPGDALAAVLCDPRSRLSRHEHWRGVTIPWARLRPDRRHDRSAGEGWRWGGPLDRNEEGYWQEQILSSSIFRVYEALGGKGETEQARIGAADYTAYLLIRAIGLLGPAAIVPAASVDHLLSSLIDADIGTRQFMAGARRTGGTAYKIVVWAFEQQGLPAPLVDLYIDGVRGGGYLRPSTGGSDPTIDSNGKVRLKIGNRGTGMAKGAQVTVWAIDAANGNIRRPAHAPVYQSKTFQLGAGKVTAMQFGWKPEKGKVLLAEVACEDDRSIIDPDTALPCALDGAPLDQLLNGDNNLARIATA